MLRDVQSVVRSLSSEYDVTVCTCCRHAANSRKGYDKDAKKDKEKAFMLLQQMCA
jgi:hypothetical protein